MISMFPAGFGAIIRPLSRSQSLIKPSALSPRCLGVLGSQPIFDYFQNRNYSLVVPRRYELPRRISPKRWGENMKKIKALKEKLGPKYRILGRDNRRSALTKRECSSTPSQPPPKDNPRPLFEDYIYREGSELPLPPPTGSKDDINQPPYNMCSYTLSKDEYEFLFNELPASVKKSLEEVAEARGGINPEIESKIGFIPEQVDMLRRLLDIRNAPREKVIEYNDAVLKAMFDPNNDTTIELAIARTTSDLYNIRTLHGKKMHKKCLTRYKAVDRIESKRLRFLKSLRRTDLSRYVYMCNQIGIDPHSIRNA